MEIKEHDYVVLKRETNLKVVEILKNKPMNMCRMKFTLNGLIGQQFGSCFVIQNGQLVKVDVADINGDNGDQDDELADGLTRDNRRLVDSCDNQQLTKDEIITLRKKGLSGEAIVGQLIENSATFAGKSEFSQQKYIKRKKQKHVALFTVLRPTARTLVELYYNRGPTKICNLRIDSLSQILTYCNVRAGSRLMVVESCNGVLLGAILERLAGEGTVVHMYTGSAPSRQAVADGFHFSEDVLRCLHSFPLNQVSTLQRPTLPENASVSAEGSVELSASMSVANASLTAETDERMEAGSDARLSESMPADTPIASDKPATQNELPSMEVVQDDVGGSHTEAKPAVEAGVSVLPSSTAEKSSCDSDKQSASKRKWKVDDAERERRKACRQEQLVHVKTVLEAADMDGLIVAAKLHPTPIVLSLLDFIKPSRPIVVFSPYKEPLIDCYLKLRESGRVLMMSVFETWLRNYQVLPDRTHPSINMSGSGGYLLTATVVAP